MPEGRRWTRPTKHRRQRHILNCRIRSCILLQLVYQFKPTRPCCGCPSCAISTTLSRNFAGISNPVPRRTTLPRMESSFLTALYCGVASSHSPVVMLLSLNCEISGSRHDSSSTSCTDIATGVDVSGTNQINSSARFVHTPFLFQDVKVGQQCFVYQVHTAL